MKTEHAKNLHDWVALACLWESTARKPGNVHPLAGFGDLTYADFAVSAVAVARVFARSPTQPVGGLVLRAIEETRSIVRTNTNLGIVLLLAPMAAASPGLPLRASLPAILEGLTLDDARLVFEAIRTAKPGGLGQVAEQDVREEPTLPLRQVMAMAQDRDMIARQYANEFREVLDEGVPALVRGLDRWANLEDAIVGAHLELLARHADSLIARRCGLGEAREASRRAMAVLDSGWPETPVGQAAFADLDAWLRQEGNRRNPGTTADLVTACIFAALRDNIIRLPNTVPWSRS